MHAFKLSITVILSCCVALPAFAQSSGSSGARKMPTDMMNRKVYMEQMMKAFDLMDVNHNGQLESDELSGGAGRIEEGTRREQAIEDAKKGAASAYGRATAPSSTTQQPATGGGIPPVNANELQK